MPTIDECMQRYLRVVKSARSVNTATSYGYGLQKFSTTLRDNDLNPKTSSVDALTEEHIALFIDDLKGLKAISESNYLTAAMGFYKFLGSENIKSFNYPRIEAMIKFRKRKPSPRMIQIPEDEMNEVLKLIDGIIEQPFDNDRDKQIAYRDRAFLFTLADTGFRVSEACSLTVGSIDFKRKRAVIVGKGNKQAFVMMSVRAIRAIDDYLLVRSDIDKVRYKSIPSSHIFARHDKGKPGEGSKRPIEPMKGSTARKFITGKRIDELLEHKPTLRITPHTWRHFFVTRFVRKKGLETARKLARHENIQTTQRYTHLTDEEIEADYRDVVD
jgi:integrase/recombinase XerC